MQKELNIAAVVSGFGGLPEKKRDTVKWLPPTLVVYGEKDEVVPVAEAKALEQLAKTRQLPITVKSYPVGHVFVDDKGKFDIKAMADAQRLMTDFLQKHLNPQKEVQAVGALERSADESEKGATGTVGTVLPPPTGRTIPIVSSGSNIPYNDRQPRQPGRSRWRAIFGIR
jgi:hypothetical protein